MYTVQRSDCVRTVILHNFELFWSNETHWIRGGDLATSIGGGRGLLLAPEQQLGRAEQLEARKVTLWRGGSHLCKSKSCTLFLYCDIDTA